MLRDNVAGLPTDETVIWTNLSSPEIARQISQLGTPVSFHIVEQLLERLLFHERSARKSVALGRHKDADAQFKIISAVKNDYLASGNPLLSIDAKSRELIGNFYRRGALHTTETIKVLDHDYPKYAEGVVIPYGIYDLRLNRGYIGLGTTRNTSEFAGDCLDEWWQREGQKQYPQATSVLLLGDGGGSNASNTYLFKRELQKLADKWNKEIRVAHLPPYESKYNPVDHRLFPHVTRACQGAIFTSVELVESLVAKTKTSTGLRVVWISRKDYQIGLKVSKEEIQSLNLVRDEILPQWNYRLLPRK